MCDNESKEEEEDDQEEDEEESQIICTKTNAKNKNNKRTKKTLRLEKKVFSEAKENDQEEAKIKKLNKRKPEDIPLKED